VILGLPASFLFLLEYWGKTSVWAFWEHYGLLEVICLVCAYLAGFNIRLVPYMAFEANHRMGKGATMIQALCAAGLTALTNLWCQHVNPLIIGWALVLGSVGWYMARLFQQTLNRSNPQLFHSVG
jgi:hypothetical protein